MINALILKDHHEYIDPNLWFGWRWKSGEPSLLVVHNSNGVFMLVRYSTFFQSHITRQYAGTDDWMELCRTCGRLTKVGSNFQCRDHFFTKLKDELRVVLAEMKITE
jgi:hypothetical protein